MTAAQTTRAVLDLVEECSPWDSSSATPTQRLLADRGFNDEDVADLCLRIEDQLGVVIPDTDLEQWRTVADVVASVDRAQGGSK